MIIPDKNRKAISKYLFQEGVCYAKKDFNLAKHPEIDVPNLQVIKLMQSFKSKEYVKETFAWMHYYCLLSLLVVPWVDLLATVLVVLPDSMETDPDLVTEMVTVLVQEGLLGNSQVKRVELQLITNLLSTGVLVEGLALDVEVVALVEVSHQAPVSLKH
uniref:40S ribosomal protein S10-1-like n=1 Tax=Tanacetum cinerariifolium TaxID=118510 RepID=A0A699IIY7_TANCI|nr:40S ribosomal protein S10-1-like [Tanacetum cinerariifolium]